MSTARRVLGSRPPPPVSPRPAPPLRVAQRRRDHRTPRSRRPHAVRDRCARDRSPSSPTTASPSTSRSTSSMPDRPRKAAARHGGAHAELTRRVRPRLRAQPRLLALPAGGLRGLVRMVFYDQRSHGRSGALARGPRDDRPVRPATCTRVLDDGRARRAGRAGRPLDGRHDDRRAGGGAPRAVRRPGRRRRADLHDRGRRSTPAGSCCRAAGRLRRQARHPGRRARWRGATGSSTGPRLGRSVALVATDGRLRRRRAGEYVDFVDDMLAATPFGVVADFFPTFAQPGQVRAPSSSLSRVPTSVICGTSRQAHRRSATAASCMPDRGLRRCWSARARGTW